MTEEERQRIKRGTPPSRWTTIIGVGLIFLAGLAMLAVVLGVVL